MSRSSKGYGRGKGGGAGLKFDTLLKACSNSKKLTANKTAGALGRFGIATFTSVRNTSLDTSGSEQTSRFSFTKKKAKLPEPIAPTVPVQSPYMSNQPQFAINPYGGITPAAPAIPRPRKFFKSRDPAAEDVNDAKSQPAPSTVAPLKIPVVKPDRSKGKSSSPEKSAKPLRTANSTSPPNAQPIKLRIFKDKATSKLIAEAPPPILNAEQSRGSTKAVGKDDKVPKKRGRKPKSFYASTDLPAPLEPQEQPPAKKGRSTRNSRKNETKVPEDAVHPLPLQQLHRNSDPMETMPVLSRASLDEHGSANNESMYSQNSCAYTHPQVNGTVENRAQTEFPAMPRKIEEDAEFQQLSQMLSSMEEGDNSYAQNSDFQPQALESQVVSQSHHSVQHQSYPTQNLQSMPVHQPIPQYSSSNQHFPYNSEMYPAYPSNQSGVSVLDQRSMCSVPRTSASSSNEETSISSQSPAKDPRDIRAILEDEWDESFDDESPKKSPPKTSRFDLSAFMPDGSGSRESTPSSPNVPTSYSNNQAAVPVAAHLTPHTIAGMIGVSEYPQSVYPQAHQQHQMNYQQQNYLNHVNQYLDSSTNSAQMQHLAHFNAPYAVRNLLSGPTDFQTPSMLPTNSTTYGHNMPGSTHNVPNAHENSVVKGDSLDKSGEALNLSVSMSTSASTPENLPVMDTHRSTTASQEVQTKSSSSVPKKGSIFKSRAQNISEQGKEGVQSNPKKRLALYKHKFGQGDGEDESKIAGEEVRGVPSAQVKTVGPDEFDDESDVEDLESMQRVPGASSDGGNGLKVLCKKNSKKLYSVIRNVKPVHELQESGEFHEFDGDVMYILEELNVKNPLMNRCLSAITLATRCMEPSFRMHLRAHGTVAEFCKEMHDAPNNPILALLASTVLFVLSQDRLNMDLDTESLKLIIALTKAPAADNSVDENPELGKLRTRVIDLVQEMKGRGHAKHLKLERITASELALETLLYLTSKRAGEWVKHELRTLGGLDYIIAEVVTSYSVLQLEISEAMFSENVIERLWKIDRCLRVLQQVTFNHEENQRYLLGIPSLKDPQSNEGSVKDQGTPDIFITLFKFCNDHLASLGKEQEAAKVLHEVLFSILRVLVNLTHDYRGIVLGSEILCGNPEFLPLCLYSVFHMSACIPDEKIFDLLMHSLCMLLNLVEHSRSNRNSLLSSRVVQYDRMTGTPLGELPALDAFIALFLAKEKAAKQDEASTDDILTKGSDTRGQDTKNQNNSSQGQSSQNSQDTDSSSVQDTIDKLIQTAGKHMENSLIAAYISLLLAYLVMDDVDAASNVRRSMPDERYLPLMVVLKKLFNFMSITSSASGSLRGLKATDIALKFYAKCDPRSSEELKKIIPD